MSNDETYLTIRQVAELLQLRQETVRRNITKGNIEAFQLGGPKSPWRIPPDALEKLEKSRRED